jgi:hypothetical protein
MVVAGADPLDAAIAGVTMVGSTERRKKSARQPA